MGAIGRNSNIADLSRKWYELRERIAASSPRSPLSGRNGPKPRTKRFLTTSDVADIIQRYERETTQQIGTRYGISKTRVATILREHGVTLRRQGLTDEQVREAIKLYAAGRSLAWLATRYDVSPMTVSTALRRQRVELRTRPGWG